MPTTVYRDDAADPVSLDVFALTSGQRQQIIKDLEQAERAITANEESERQINAALTRRLTSQGLDTPHQWKKTASLYDAYPRYWEAYHQGKRYRARICGARGEPGVSEDWEEILEPEDEVGDPVDLT